MARYCPMCNRWRETVEEDHPPFHCSTCAECGHIHAIREAPAVPVKAAPPRPPT
jgi:hypothetical protein